MDGTTEAGRARGSRFGLFRYRDFTLYWAGGLLSNVGTWLQNVTAAVHIYILTGSTLMVGLLSVATFLPILLFGLVGGVISDRMDRRRIIIVTHVISMGLVALLTALAALGLVTPLVLIGTAFAVNTAWAFAKPALTTMLPRLVDRSELTDAIATNSLQYTLGQLIGPLLSAVLLAVASPAAAYGVNTLTFLGPILAMILMRTSGAPEAARVIGERAIDALAAGLRYARRHPVIAGLLVAVASTSALPEAVRTLSPAFVVTSLHADEAAAGLLIGAQGFGAAAALLVIPWLRRALGTERFVRVGILAQATGILGLAAAPTMPAALVATFVAGVGFATVFTHVTARLLEVPSPEMQGRIMSLHTIANLGLRPATSLFAGAIAVLIDPRIVAAAFVVVAPVSFIALSRGESHSAEHHEELLRRAAAASREQH